MDIFKYIVIFSQNLNFCWLSIADAWKLIIGIPIKNQMIL